VYVGEFCNDKDICDAFGIPSIGGYVVFAGYECPGHEGYADIIFVREGKFYHVQGSHCSCYGLENQWLPEEMPLLALRHIVETGYGLLHDHRDALTAIFDDIATLGVFDEGMPEELTQVVLKLRFR
jgi:hypothetical protein